MAERPARAPRRRGPRKEWVPGSVIRRLAIGDGCLQLLLRGGVPRGGGAFLIPGGNGRAGGRRLAAVLPCAVGKSRNTPAASEGGGSGPGMSPGSPEPVEGPGTSGKRGRDPGEPGLVKGWGVNGTSEGPSPLRKRMCGSRPPLAFMKSVGKLLAASRRMLFLFSLITFCILE